METRKAMFTIDDKYTERANKLSEEAHAVIKPIFDQWVEKGHSSIDIEYVLEWVVKECGLAARLR